EPLHVALAAHELPAAALHARLDPEDVGARPLRVEIPEQRLRSAACREVSEVQGGRRLADAALDVVGGEDACHRNVFFTSPRCSGDENAAKRSLNSARASFWCSRRRSTSIPIAISVSEPPARCDTSGASARIVVA